MTGSAPSKAAGRPAESPAAEPAPRRLPLILVTGLSGAGHSTALKILEDMGYEAVDNLPLSLLGRMAGGGGGIERPVAIGVDSRTRDFSAAALGEALDLLLQDPTVAVRLLFLTASDEAMRRRFTETRRRHPLADDRPVSDGIRLERERLAWARNRADLVVDTSGLALPDLRRLLAGHFAISSEGGLGVDVVSFGYRYGLPPESDLVFDVRFLSNPHYEPNLRSGTGLDEPVAAFIQRDSAYSPFFATLSAMLTSLLPAYEREGKSYLTIAIGCTGGRHRSVYVAARLAEALRGAGWQVGLRHRDLERSAPARD